MHDALNAAICVSTACHGPRPPLRDGQVPVLWRSRRSASACARDGGRRCNRQRMKHTHTQHRTLRHHLQRRSQHHRGADDRHPGESCAPLGQEEPRGPTAGPV